MKITEVQGAYVYNDANHQEAGLYIYTDDPDNCYVRNGLGRDDSLPRVILDELMKLSDDIAKLKKPSSKVPEITKKHLEQFEAQIRDYVSIELREFGSAHAKKSDFIDDLASLKQCGFSAEEIIRLQQSGLIGSY